MFKSIFCLLILSSACLLSGCETIAAFRSGDLVMDDVNRMLKLERGTDRQDKPEGSLGLLRSTDIWMRTNLW